MAEFSEEFPKNYYGQACGMTTAACGVYMCWVLNSHWFPVVGDGHQPNSRGLYTHYDKDSL